MTRSNPIFDKLIHFSTAETTICVLLLSFGVYVGTSKMLSDQPILGPKYAPAVMWACGHGLATTRFEPTSEARDTLQGFLRSKEESFDCAVLDGTVTPVPRLNKLQRSMRYMMLSMGFSWRLLGVSWSSLAPLLGLFCGLFTVGVYLLSRLAMGRCFAVAVAVLLTISPDNLLHLHRLRDYPKIPFLILGIALMGYLVVRELRPASRLAIAAAFGLTAGIGLGFRDDILLLLPFSVVAIVFLLPRRIAWRERGLIFLVVAIVFAVITLPISLNYGEGGANLWHILLMGVTNTYNPTLAVSTEPYFLAAYSGDFVADDLVYLFASPFHDIAKAELGPIDYELYSRELYLTYLAHFPADILVRAYASVIRVIPAPDWFPVPIGAPLVLLAVALFALRDIRFAAFAVLVILYFGGASSLEFEDRHYHHLVFIPVISLAFLVNLLTVWGASKLPVRFRGLGMRKSKTATPQALPDPGGGNVRLTNRVGKAGLFLCTIAIVGGSSLAVARAYQQSAATEFFDGLSAARRQAVSLRRETKPDGTVLLRPTGMLIDTKGRTVEHLATDSKWSFFYFVAEVSGPGGCSGNLVIEWESSRLSYNARVSTDPGKSGLVFFPGTSPPTQIPIHRKTMQFSGLRPEGFDESCLVRLYTVDGFDQIRLPMTVVLNSEWRERPLYQRLVLEQSMEIFLAGLGRPVVNVYKSELLTRRDDPVAVTLPLEGAELLVLRVDGDGKKYTRVHANWINPQLVNSSTVLPLNTLQPILATQISPTRICIAREPIRLNWGVLKFDSSLTGRPLTFGGKAYKHGLGTHGHSKIVFRIPKWFDSSEATFQVLIGVDDNSGRKDPVRFYVDLNKRPI